MNEWMFDYNESNQNNYNILHPDAHKSNKNSKNASTCKLISKYVLRS